MTVNVVFFFFFWIPTNYQLFLNLFNSRSIALVMALYCQLFWLCGVPYLSKNYSIWDIFKNLYFKCSCASFFPVWNSQNWTCVTSSCCYRSVGNARLFQLLIFRKWAEYVVKVAWTASFGLQRFLHFQIVFFCARWPCKWR